MSERVKYEQKILGFKNSAFLYLTYCVHLLFSLSPQH